MRGYVLAGGLSSRMGLDKARLPEDGWPAAIRLYERMLAAGLEPALVRRTDDGLPWPLPDGGVARVVWEDSSSIRHPLQGILTAARDAGAPFFVCPCDMVRLSVGSMRRLVEAGALAANHPLAGVYPGPNGVQQAIEDGRSVRSFVADRAVVTLPDDETLDRNSGGGPWPPEQLATRLAHVARLDVDAVVRGERQRLAVRGVLVPTP